MHGLVSILSGERWLTSKRRRPNGGTVILYRSIQLSLELFLIAIALQQSLDPERSWAFDVWELLRAASGNIEWLGAIFAASYAALYARFANQWAYLASVYNQIKAAQSQQGSQAEVIAQWKAGFIEDAEDLHLVSKPIFASIIKNWSSEPDVVEAFESLAPGGRDRLLSVKADAERAVREQEAKRAKTYQIVPPPTKQ